MSIHVHTRSETTAGRARRRIASALAAAVATTALGLAAASPAQAAIVCGLSEFDQNVFAVNDGFWDVPGNWSQNHIPAGGESVCVPGGIVARVRSNTTGLVAGVGNLITTLRVEGTVRIESGTTVSLATAIFGGSNLINGGVIQVLGNSTFDMNADQNGAPAFQNAVGGSLIQVAGGSRVLLRRAFVNAGTVDLTGGGQFVLDSPASAYSTTNNGAMTGGSIRMTAGTVTYGGNGALSALAIAGNVRGTLGSAQSLDVACNIFSGGVDLSQGLVNNGAITFRPPLAGDCEQSYTLPGGQTLTNNGALTFGVAGQASPSIRFSSNVFNAGGTIVNAPSGVITVNDNWLSDDRITNQGTLTIAAGGRLEQRSHPMVNSGTIVNRNSCDFRELQNTGTVELVTNCLVRRSATFAPSSVLRAHWTETALAKLTVGLASTLGGTVDVVTTGAVPTAGTTRDLVTGPVSGTFANVTSQQTTVGYTALYPNGSTVQLQAGAGTGGGGGGGGGAIDAIVPGRLLDTRPGEATVDGVGAGAGFQQAGSTVEVQVTGRSNVPSDATAAVLNVTVTQAQGPGFATVYPCGSDRPTASNLNFGAGSTVPNGAIAKIGTGGRVCVFVSNGAHVLADVTGFFRPSSPYTPLQPARLLDTRPGSPTVDGVAQGAGVVPAGGVVELPVAGRGNVPGTAAAAVLNVTVTGAEGPGFVTVYPCGTDRPTTSSLNFDTGSTVPNNVIAKIGTGGTVCLYTSTPTHLIADVNGAFAPSAAFEPIAPARLLDSRPDSPTVDGAGAGAGFVGGGTVVEVQVTGRAGVPATAGAAVLNVTVTGTGGAGFVTAFPCGTQQPTASSLNYGTGTTVPNGLISKIGTGGKVCLFTSAGTHLIADLNGWFAG